MNYKGYTAKVEYDADDRVFHGRVTGISDVVTFEGVTEDELEVSFRSSVDEYVAFCQEQGRTPQHPSTARSGL